MKKITTLLASIILYSLSFSQGNEMLKNVTKNYILGKVEAAKQEIDKLMGNPSVAADPEVLIWSLTLDAEVINNAALAAQYPNLINGWLERFKAYEKADPSLTQITSPAINWKPLGLMYDKFYNDGRIAYGNQKWTEAFESFEQCAHLAKIIMKKDLMYHQKVAKTHVERLRFQEIKTFSAIICYNNLNKVFNIARLKCER